MKESHPSSLKKMSPRKLLLLTYHFPPSGAVAVYRMLGLARHLPAHGWETVVVAPPAVPGEPVDPELVERIPPGTAVHRVPYPHGKTAKVVRRLAPEGMWLPGALAACRRAIDVHRPDALLTSSPPHCVHLLGRYLKRRHGLPWLVDFRDPWVTDRVPGVGRPVLRFLEPRWENSVVAHADAVIANTPLSQRGLQAAYPAERHKVVAIPNGYDPEDFPAPAPRADKADAVTVLHAGELYAGRDPRPLLDALLAWEAERRPGQKPVRMRFLGRATEGTFDLAGEVRRRGLQAVVELGGQVPYRQALEAMTQADFLLLITSPDRRMGIPAKLYEYLGAGRPILALAERDGDVAWALQASCVRHRCAATRDVAGIRHALEELSQELPFPASGPVARFTRARMGNDVADLLDRCVGRRPDAAPRAEGTLTASACAE